MHLHGPGLADPVGPVGRLLLDRRVPPAVDVDHVVGAGQVEAGAAGLEGEQEHRRTAGLGPGLKQRHHRLPVAHRGAAVEELVGHARLGQVALEQPRHRDVLGEDERRTVFGDHRRQDLVEQVELLGAPSEPDGARLLEELRRVVADLLEAGQQRQHQAAPGVVVGALDAVHRVAHERLVEHDLLAGQRQRVVGLGLGGQLGGDARVGLATPEQERLDQVGELARLGRHRAGLDRPGPDLAERVAAAEQARRAPVEDRPELGEVVLHRGAGERDPPTAGDGAQRPRGRGPRVLHMLGLVGHDEVPGDGVERGVVDPHRAVGGQHEARLQLAEVALGAVEAAYVDSWREPADLGLPVAEETRRTHHERRPESAGGTRRAGTEHFDPVQVERDHRHRLAEPHVVGQARAETELGEVGQPGEPVALVVAQVGVQTRGGWDRGAGGGGHEALADLEQRGADDDRGLRRRTCGLDLHHPGQRSSDRLGRLDGADQPLPGFPGRGRVDDGPAAAQLEDRGGRPRELVHLLGGERVAVQRHLPAEAEQGIGAEQRLLQRLLAPHRGRTLRRTCVEHRRRSEVAAQAARPHHVDPTRL